MKPLTRRSVTTGLAAAGADVPWIEACKGRPGELAALFHLYSAKRAVYRVADTAGDEGLDEALYADLQAAEFAMRRVPVRSAEDALAVLDYLEERELIAETWGGDAKDFVESLVAELRAYLAGMDE